MLICSFVLWVKQGSESVLKEVLAREGISSIPSDDGRWAAVKELDDSQDLENLESFFRSEQAIQQFSLVFSAQYGQEGVF